MTATRAARPALDLLALPGLRLFVRWRHARLALQLPLLALALLAIYDGLSGPQLAGLNVATVSVWVHYRGLLALGLALVGNLFCAACPLMLTRGPSRWLRSRLPQFSWPRKLRNKYLVLGLTALFLLSYEVFDLWASPWLTAWIILGYFGAVLLTDSVFPVGTFCAYVCPLGNFNFALSRVSPAQIQAVDLTVCAGCAGKNCLNGRSEPLPVADFSTLPPLGLLPSVPASIHLPGCETRLYVPTMTSMQDCTLCLNCVRACPHDNVALAVRSPLHDAVHARPRPDLALYLTLLSWAGLVNAFAMTPPYFRLAQQLAGLLGTRNEALLLTLILLGSLGAGARVTWLAARWAGVSVRAVAPLLLPLTLAVWGGHYLYHFMLGASTLWPAVVQTLIRLGLPLAPGDPPSVPRIDSSFWLQAALLNLALGATFWAVLGRFTHFPGGVTLRALTVQVALVLLYVTLALLIFAQPMQARLDLLVRIPEGS